jgi:vacuolar-type H+-ATPase subunit E/Vma4
MQILETKTQYSQKLTEKAIIEIKNRKKKNPEVYWNYLLKSLEQFGNIIQSECILMIIQEDLDLFKKNRDLISKKYPKLSIIPNSEDFFGGFKILSKDHRIEIDQTLKTLIQRSQKEISRIITTVCSHCIVQMTDAI